MKATEAKKLTEEYNSVSDITFIIMRIKSATGIGKSQIEVDDLRQGQREALVKLGYTIYGTTISW